MKNYTIERLESNSRLHELALHREGVLQFLKSVESISLNSLQMFPRMRSAMSDVLRMHFGECFIEDLQRILATREFGAVVVRAQGADENVTSILQLATGLLCSVAEPWQNEAGRYYGMVESKIHKAAALVPSTAKPSRLGVHTDHPPQGRGSRSLDVLLFAKLSETCSEGGNTLLIHMDDWKGLQSYLENPIGWSGPNYVFYRRPFGTSMTYGRNLIEPLSELERSYHTSLRQAHISLHETDSLTKISLPPGSMYLVNNCVWLHGREALGSKPDLFRLGAVMWGHKAEWSENSARFN